jgi:hypothetical protein
MTLALIAAGLMVQPNFQANQAPLDTYTDSRLGLSFTHPTTWILEKENAPMKGKKTRKSKSDDSVHFRIPLTGAVDDADLVVFRAQFSGSADTWQKIQVDTNADLKRTVDRQWDQEILGVPLLLTRISYTENGTPKTTLTGLLYNQADSKLLFRLTGPSSDFDKAQYQFTDAMQTLRTTNNALPSVNDPDHPAQKVVPDRGVKHAIFSPPPPPKPILAPVAIPLIVSTKNVILRVGRGWSAVNVHGSELELKSSEIPYLLKVRVFSVLDSDPPDPALAKASAASLAAFSTVTTRHDDPLAPNLAGCIVTSIWRTGSTAKGPLMSYDAMGKSGDFYFLATAAPRPGDTVDTQKKALSKLLDTISIDSTQ